MSYCSSVISLREEPKDSGSAKSFRAFSFASLFISVCVSIYVHLIYHGYSQASVMVGVKVLDALNGTHTLYVSVSAFA